MSIRCTTLALLGMLAVASPSLGEQLLLSAGDELWTLDTSDGVPHLLGQLPVGGNEILELAQSPGGSYYGVAGGSLYAIDPLGVDAVAIGSLDTLGTVAGLAFDASGTLYGLQWDEHLYTIDLANAAVDYLGQVGIGGPIHTLDADSLGNLVAATYLIFEPDFFVQIDTGTLNDLLVSPAPDGISAMVLSEDDTAFAFSDTTSMLYQVDLDAGTWTELYQLEELGDVEGMELIPEPGALICLTIGLVLCARKRG